MNLESFENEIAQLENQLQDAIAAVAILKDIQVTFQDVEPRYEHLKQLTDELAGLPEHFNQQFNAARQQVDARLVLLEQHFTQQQDSWKAKTAQHQQAHAKLRQETDQSLTDLRQQCAHQQSALDALTAQYQQDQTALHQNLAQFRAELQHTITEHNEQLLLMNTNLRESTRNAQEELKSQLRQTIKHRFNSSLFVGLLALIVASGTLAMVLLKG